MVGQYRTSSGGIVAAEELAPYLDLDSAKETDDDSYILPVLLLFDGQPEVDEKGNILYHFPSLQRTAAPERSGRKEYFGRNWSDWSGGVEKFFKEKKWKLSKTSASERAMVIGLGGLNLFGVLILGSMLKAMTVSQSGLISFMSNLFPLFQDGELDGDVAHRIKAGWLKWKSATGVLCDPDMPHRLKGKFYRTAITPALLYGTECWAIKQCHVQKMNVGEMRMLRWMCGHTKKDRLRNEVIREKVRVASIEDKMMENRLRWFGHVRRRPVDAPVRRLESWRTINIVKGRGRPKKTWIKLIENDMRFLGIGGSMAMERQIWKERIRVVDEI
ncbi:hypothetical protein OROGR_017675 [Orobanche gracilis]